MSYDITTTSGTEVSGFNYNNSDSYTSGVSSYKFGLLSNSTANVLALSFFGGLSTGGTVPLYTSYLSSEGDGRGYRMVDSGYATTLTIPEPTTLALLGLGLAGLGYTRHRARK